MKVSFSFGKKSTTTLINTLKKMADNIEFYPYNTIGELVKESQLRKLFFDRIVFSEKILSNPKKELTVLNDYIKNYSDSTEIVMVANPKGSKATSAFVEIFDSPMYTPVILEKPTPTSLLELVKGDILELKTKYFVLDVKKSTKPEDTSKKKGIFGGFKSTKNEEVGKSVQNVEDGNPIPNTGESPSSSNEDNMSGSNLEPSAMGGGTGVDVQNVLNYNGFGFGFSENVSGIGKSETVDSSNFKDDFEDDGLSLGDLGSQHSDTGFLDEDGEEELEAFAKSRDTQPVQEDFVEEYTDSDEDAPDESYEDYEEQESYDEPIEEDSHELEVEQPMCNTKIFILIGERGTGVTQTVVDKSVKLAERGTKVLVLDLDVKTNGLLSFIDTNKFYKMKCQNGIVNQIVYSEDGVDMVSSGYGGSLSEAWVRSLLDGVGRKYTNILVDCPIESLKYIPMSVLQKSNLCIMVNGERDSLISTSLALTDRNNLSLEAERCIMENCSVKVVGNSSYLEEDLNYLRSTCFFPNGSWLNNIS